MNPKTKRPNRKPGLRLNPCSMGADWEAGIFNAVNALAVLALRQHGCMPLEITSWERETRFQKGLTVTVRFDWRKP